MVTVLNASVNVFLFHALMVTAYKMSIYVCLCLAQSCPLHLGGACYFSTLDLQSGYWQVPVKECDRRKRLLLHLKGYINSRECRLA